ncbi:hypothetical protein M885DRAFT_63486 [Pelagophyceae sp. CCMP2097]|nr:hypothetical protein M885DRAFT_63486 [Pelagophyceae sp. CCMP2097]
MYSLIPAARVTFFEARAAGEVLAPTRRSSPAGPWAIKMRRVPSTRSAGTTAGFCAGCGQALAQTSTGGGRSGRGKLPSRRRFLSFKGTPTSPSLEATLGSRTDSGRVASGFTSAAHRRTSSGVKTHSRRKGPRPCLGRYAVHPHSGCARLHPRRHRTPTMALPTTRPKSQSD